MKKCSVCKTKKGKLYRSKKFGRILCERHYKQLWRTGKTTIRNQNNRNKIVKKIIMPSYFYMIDTMLLEKFLC